MDNLRNNITNIMRNFEDAKIYTYYEKDVNNIINNEPITHGNSEDSLKTMQLVYRIYYADKAWREKYNIRDPNQFD